MPIHQKIVKHGLQWVANGSMVVCPECNSSSFEIQSIECEHDRPLTEDIYTAQLKCKTCHCEFEISRIEYTGC